MSSNSNVQTIMLPDGDKIEYKRLKDGTYLLAHQEKNIHKSHIHLSFNYDGSHTILSNKTNGKHSYKYSGQGSARKNLSKLYEEITNEVNKFDNRWQPRHQINAQGNPMSNLQRYDRVLAGLQTAKGNIRQNISQLQSQLDLYSRQIEAMKQVGFLEDYTEKLKAYHGLKNLIDSLKGYLQQIHHKIGEIEVHIQQLKQHANSQQ